MSENRRDGIFLTHTVDSHKEMQAELVKQSTLPVKCMHQWYINYSKACN